MEEQALQQTVFEFATKLHSQVSAPPGIARRNDVKYEAASYLNSVLVFLLASNLPATAVHVRRAQVAIMRQRDSFPESYLATAEALLALAKTHVLSSQDKRAIALLTAVGES